MSRRITVWKGGRRFKLVSGRSYVYQNGKFYRRHKGSSGCLIYVIIILALLFLL
ncbi:MAG: hypothetical protein LBB88_04975 [Planctomycetaceae bacterium]|nr:hypothetical protein [Planctomycetaceae bacterium]